MYERCVNEGKPSEYNLYRMMIDKLYQNKGIGSVAMQLLLDEMNNKQIVTKYLFVMMKRVSDTANSINVLALPKWVIVMSMRKC
ncbi:GNAT family N-acetyltransferase [Xenorhabdus cabanillasii]|uniref:N-acetyltransferase domain-containing protein n=1 Tax=Xenorhabdus cabanillasii JM26 TaxID=1427517 RepID=W1J738_9GAMM|nr:GNAT family N-acetyltransferase [Xenorhabdus cabanillasii]PHM78538.1 GNAT family N-acetyltransferase [Xenorhabdus cabanillasii JM26]CDL85848.1 hypothetical protein XCR1_2500010 [Xenorhabdus cabanillasii JM26]